MYLGIIVEQAPTADLFIQCLEPLQRPQAVNFLGRAGLCAPHRPFDRCDRPLPNTIDEFIHSEHPASKIAAAQFGDQAVNG